MEALLEEKKNTTMEHTNPLASLHPFKETNEGTEFDFNIVSAFTAGSSCKHETLNTPLS